MVWFGGGFRKRSFWNSLKKSCFLAVNGFDSNSGSADKDLAIKLSSSKYKYIINKKRLVNKRVSPNQWSKNYKSMYINNFKFYNKYKKSVGLSYKILLIKKIIKLFTYSILR